MCIIVRVQPAPVVAAASSCERGTAERPRPDLAPRPAESAPDTRAAASRRCRRGCQADRGDSRGYQTDTDDGAGDREEHDECQVSEKAHPSSCSRTRIPKDETHAGRQRGTDCCQQQTISDGGAGSFDGRRPRADAGRFMPQQRNGNDQRERHDTQGRRHGGSFPPVKQGCTMTPRQPARCRHQPLSANADSKRRHNHR